MFGIPLLKESFDDELSWVASVIIYKNLFPLCIQNVKGRYFIEREREMGCIHLYDVVLLKAHLSQGYFASYGATRSD